MIPQPPRARELRGKIEEDISMRRILWSVMMGALGWTLWAAPAAAAGFQASQLSGTYVSEFDIHFNDPKSTGIFISKEVNAGLVTAIQELGTALSAKKCTNAVFPGGLSASEIGGVLKKLTVGIGDEMTGTTEITYDGNGSLVGEGVFNFFQQSKYSETGSLASFNATNTGITTRICGGPAAKTEDLRCKPVCTVTGSSNSPYNCADQYMGTNSTNLNPGGGGYVVAGAGLTTATLPFANDVGSTSVLHFYLSAFGICGSANSFAECCGDPKIDVVLHVPAANLPGNTTQVTESFGTVGDVWGSGTFHSKLSE
jgi:hypothetical protein